MKKGKIGSSFDDFLKEEGIYEGAQASAIKRVIAWQLQKAMEDENITKSEMARRMKTSRSQLEGLLDPGNVTVQLDTVMKAAAALGKDMHIELVNKRRKVA
ncbi:MAG TPA: helix-turn-helix transcriptional regulator [Nitrospiria bacterium]